MRNTAAVKGRLGMAFRIVCIVGTAVALWLFVRKLDVGSLGGAFQRATLWALVLVVLLNVASHFVRAQGWLAMLRPGVQIPFGHLLRYEFAAQAASSISPARAGEGLRIWLLKQDDVPATTTVQLIASKKLFEGAGLMILVVAVPWLLPGLPGWISSSIVLIALLMVSLLVTLVIVARWSSPARVPRILNSVAGGMYLLRDSRRLVAVLALALVGEAADLGAAALLLHGLHIDVPIAAAGLILFMVDFTNLLPAAPGQLGTFEVGALSALELLHVQPEAALAFAVLFHAQQVLPQVVFGLPFELHFLVARRRSVGALDVPSEGAAPPAFNRQA